MGNNVMEIDMSISDVEVIDAQIFSGNEEIGYSLKDTISVGGTTDYLKLKNKPSINGTELIGNYDEIDPTVPAWAKEPAKPTYSPSEIGALSDDAEMSFSEIKEVWDSIFKEENNNG